MEINAVSPVMDEYDLADLNFYNIEKTLNKCSYVPIVGHFSGLARTLLGGVQAIAGLSTAIFFRSVNLQEIDKKELLYRSRRHDHIGTHGLANIFRGSYETGYFFYYLGIPFVDPGLNFLFIGVIVSLTTYLYDRSGYRIPYIGELKDKNIQQIQVK